MFPSEIIFFFFFAAIFQTIKKTKDQLEPKQRITNQYNTELHAVMCQMLFYYYYLFLVDLSKKERQRKAKIKIYCIKHREKFILNERNLINCFNNFNKTKKNTLLLN